MVTHDTPTRRTLPELRRLPAHARAARMEGRAPEEPEALVQDEDVVSLPRDGSAHHVLGAAMTRRDPNAPNPYYLLAQLRDAEMAERARLAVRGIAVIAPRRVAAHERPTCCPAYSEHERCAAHLVCAVLRERCERRRCQ